MNNIIERKSAESTHMFEQAMLARIFTNGSAMSGDRHLAEVIVDRARLAKLLGATVLRGQSGFGRFHRQSAGSRFELGDDRPLVIEIVDSEERLRAFLLSLQELAPSLITLERVEVIFHKQRPGDVHDFA